MSWRDDELPGELLRAAARRRLEDDERSRRDVADERPTFGVRDLGASHKRAAVRRRRRRQQSAHFRERRVHFLALHAA